MYKAHCVFNCAIASKSAHWGGVYRLRTTSGISASQLVGSLQEIQQLTGGVLRGIPLRLALRPIQVSPNGTTTTVYVVHVELIGDDLAQIQAMAMERSRTELANVKAVKQAQLEYRRLLRAPGIGETAEEQAEIAAEFHPQEPEAISAAPAPSAPVAPASTPPIDTADLDRDDIAADIRGRIDAATEKADLDKIALDMMRQHKALGEARYPPLLERWEMKRDLLANAHAGTEEAMMREPGCDDEEAPEYEQ
jgi:hypothetical protein